jgi:hypothetical protein
LDQNLGLYLPNLQAVISNFNEMKSTMEGELENIRKVNDVAKSRMDALKKDIDTVKD